MYRSIIALFACILVSSCFGGKDGKLEVYYIACEKGEDKNWHAPDAYLGRFDVIHKTTYNVSFESQRVVSSSGHALGNCQVFDKNNWACDGFRGRKIYVEDGDQPTHCGSALGSCYRTMGLNERLFIYINGAKQAEKYCKDFSSLFDSFHELGL